MSLPSVVQYMSNELAMVGTQTCHGELSLFHDALALDASILHQILQRNRQQHFRAQYYRRLSMVLLALKRYNLLGLANLINTLQEEHERRVSSLERYKGVRKRKAGVRGKDAKIEEEEWTLSKGYKAQTTQLSNFFLIKIKELHERLTVHLPEICSRISHAASALFTELSRGYFVPLCTSCLAAISRIRVILLQWGRQGITRLQNAIIWIQSDIIGVITGGGELEGLLDLKVDEVHSVLGEGSGIRVNDLSGLMESFLEVGQAQHSSFMEEWRLGRSMRRDGTQFTRKLGLKERHPGHNTNGKNLIEVSDCGVRVSSVHEEEVELVSKESLFIELDTGDDAGDRNLEMVKLLRQKKKRERTRIENSRDVPKKKLKTSNTLVDDWSNLLSGTCIEKNVVKEKKKKEKRKKKSKKKKKADVLDDIFD